MGWEIFYKHDQSSLPSRLIEDVYNESAEHLSSLFVRILSYRNWCVELQLQITQPIAKQNSIMNRQLARQQRS